ncbi:MAG: CoA transferase [Deltaproteobacteria bacterium]|nr:CoA transferase [Deltaproteobacteria bacterium]
MPPPLAGVRVLDLSRLLPGPFCTLILAELGAEVVKVEDLGGGDYLRLVPPFKGGLGGAFYALNRGKRSIAVDLKQASGRELLLRLLPSFDVVVESFRPGVLARLGLDYATLAAAHPKLVLCSISGYGQDGPMADRAGHDINYLATAGVLAASGPVGGAPMVPGVQLADVAGGALWATIRILAALKSGVGAHLDVSMTEGVMSFLLPWLGDLAFGGTPLRRGEGTLNGGAACYGAYRGADGGYLAVGALEPKFWTALRTALGQPSDMSDPIAPPARQTELKGELAARLAERSRDEWARELASADACVEPVLEMEELTRHPHHQHRQMFFTLDDATRGPLEMLRLPLGAPVATTPAPTHGQHTDEVLREAGLSDAEIASLRQRGVLR